MSNTEQTEYIKGLNDQRPTGDEPISYGDDHIRLIKKAVQQSFAEVGGPVTANEIELSYVKGATSNIQDQLDAGGTQILQNQNDIEKNKQDIENLWKDSQVQQDAIIKNRDDIAALNTKVDEQEIGDHADVEYSGAPEDGDVLVYDESIGKWTAKRVGGAGVTKMIAQPKVVGDFEGDGSSAENTWRVIKTSNGWLTFTVPSDLKFILQNITTSGDGRVSMSGSNGIKIDGVQPYADWYASGAGIGQYNDGWPVGAQGSGPLVEVKDSIQVYVGYLVAGEEHQVRISGIFAEDK